MPFIAEGKTASMEIESGFFEKAVIFPRWAATTALATERPMPYPPVWEFLDWSAR